MKTLKLTLASVAIVFAAQTQTVSISPRASTDNAGVDASKTAPSQPEARRQLTIGAAVLGYIAGPGAAELHPIVGALESPALGDAVELPADTRRVYLPPTQQYALVTETDQPVSIWTLRGTAATEHATRIAGGISAPDLVAFSPRGEAAVLYSRSSNSVQVLHNLPAEDSVARQLSLQTADELSSIAVTDDAALVIATFGDGRFIISSMDGPWRSLAIAFAPATWSFLPHSHDLVISDRAQQELVLFTKIDETGAAVRILAQDVQADRLAITKDGEQLVAASIPDNKLWRVELNTGVVTPLTAGFEMNSLVALRDGYTFLLASPPSSLLRLVKSTVPDSTAVNR